MTLAAWAVMGFAGIAAYPRLLSADADAFAGHSHSLTSLAIHLGASPGVARALALAAAAGAIVLAWRSRRHGNDLAAFTLCLYAGLLSSPIVWTHYLLVLLVPLAIARPRLDRAWIAFALLSSLSRQEPPGATALLALGFLTSIALAGASLERTRRPAPALSIGRS